MELKLFGGLVVVILGVVVAFRSYSENKNFKNMGDFIVYLVAIACILGGVYVVASCFTDFSFLRNIKI
jgi:prolipoprotein diacylglyceryltransferase